MDKKIWIGLIGGMAVADLWCAKVKRSGTLSQAGREVFRTDTKTGRIAWVVSWGALSAWLLPHIWNVPEEIIDKIS